MDPASLLIKGAKHGLKKKQVIQKLDGGEEEYRARKSMQRISGVGAKTSKKLYEAGFESKQDVANSSIEELKQIDGFGEKRAKEIRKKSRSFIANFFG